MLRAVLDTNVLISAVISVADALGLV